MMDPELKIEWVNRLRSGRYPQGEGYLSWNGKFCCLGVLGEILVERGVCEKRETFERVVSYGLNGAYGNGYLSIEIMRAIGVDYSIQNKYANMNDRKVPFSQIADVIEADTSF